MVIETPALCVIVPSYPALMSIPAGAVEPVSVAAIVTLLSLVLSKVAMSDDVGHALLDQFTHVPQLVSPPPPPSHVTTAAWAGWASKKLPAIPASSSNNEKLVRNLFVRDGEKVCIADNSITHASRDNVGRMNRNLVP